MLGHDKILEELIAIHQILARMEQQLFTDPATINTLTAKLKASSDALANAEKTQGG